EGPAEPPAPGGGMNSQPLHVTGAGSAPADHVAVEPVAPAVHPEPHRRGRPEGVLQPALVEPPEGVEGGGVDGQDPGPVAAPRAAEPVPHLGGRVEVVDEELELLLDVEAGAEEARALGL